MQKVRFVSSPACQTRSRSKGVSAGKLRLKCPTDSDRNSVGRIQNRSKRDGKSVSQLSSLMDTSGCLGIDMGGVSSREGERSDELGESLSVEAVLGVKVANGSFLLCVNVKERGVS